MVERCALSGSDLKIKFRTTLLTSIVLHRKEPTRTAAPADSCVRKQDRHIELPVQEKEAVIRTKKVL